MGDAGGLAGSVSLERGADAVQTLNLALNGGLLPDRIGLKHGNGAVLFLDGVLESNDGAAQPSDGGRLVQHVLSECLDGTDQRRDRAVCRRIVAEL